MKKKWTGQILNHSVGIWPCGHSLDVRTSPPAETIGHLFTIIFNHQKHLQNDTPHIDNMFTIASLPHGTYTFIFKECGYENHRQEYTI